jgi:hypothetical protein
MILRELFYFDKETVEPPEDDRYEPEYDQTSVDFDDTRKTRLTLMQINRIRKGAELHNKDKAAELDFIKQMYGISANATAGGA